MIKLSAIHKTYANGFHALKGIDLEVQKGDIMGIIGYSGAGKSTLIRIINRLEEASSGSIVIDGVDLGSLSESALQKQRQKIGMIFQHFNLLSSRTVFGNVAFALEIAKWEKSTIKPRVNELLEIVGLSERAAFYPSQLSGGQKQRVAIARALANHPKILLCDEATSALDTKTTKSILALLRDIQQRLGLTVVLITHQIEVVREICNKMCVISEGEIIERGSVSEIFAAPRHPITRELIAFMPKDEGNIIAHLKDTKNVYRVIFTGPNSHSPLISQMIREFKVDVNILSGSIDELATGEVGHLVIKFVANDKDIKLALDWLLAQGVTVESLESNALDSGDSKDLSDFGAKSRIDSKKSKQKSQNSSAKLSVLAKSHADSKPKSKSPADSKKINSKTAKTIESKKADSKKRIESKTPAKAGDSKPKSTK